MRIRPMRPDDADLAAEVVTRSGAPGVIGDVDGRGARWTRRARHLIQADPGGCWVADDDGVVGVALSARRDLLWVLSSFAVLASHHRRGIGRALLDAAIGYGAGCLRGMVWAPPDPGLLRLIRLAGFTLHPTMRLAGTVDRRALPVVDAVREGTSGDLDLVDSVDRRVRGAPHGPDHDVLSSHGPLLVCDLLTGSGYAYLQLSGASVGLLAATNRAVGQRLLWEALARTPPGADVRVRALTAEQEWALDVGLAAGLRIEPDGYLALRHMRPPPLYVPSLPFG